MLNPELNNKLGMKSTIDGCETDEEVYMPQPPRYEKQGNTRLVCRLQTWCFKA